MRRRQLTVMSLCVLVVFAEMAIAQQPPAGISPPGSATRLKKVELGSMRPVTVFGDIFLAGQPSPNDLALLKSQGIKTIINLRHAKEIPWDEAVAVEQAGMKYVHAPFSGPQQLKPEIFDKVINTLRDKRRGPTVFHCGSANRVGAIWYAYRVIDSNLSPDKAMKEAQEIGLRTPAYLEKAQEYVEATKRKETETKATSFSE